MNAPKLVESIPTVTAPVRLSEVRERRARFLANVITGGALLVIASVLLVLGIVVSL